MSDPSMHEQLVQSVRTNADKWLEQVEKLLRLPPTDPNFPSSILLLAPVHASSGSPMVWMKTIQMTTPSHPDGWLHALQLSRDMLVVLAQLDNDFQLGIPHLAELVTGHPLLRDVQVSLEDGQRVVHELVEDGGTIGDDRG